MSSHPRRSAYLRTGACVFSAASLCEEPLPQGRVTVGTGPGAEVVDARVQREADDPASTPTQRAHEDLGLVRVDDRVVRSMEHPDRHRAQDTDVVGDGRAPLDVTPRDRDERREPPRMPKSVGPGAEAAEA